MSNFSFNLLTSSASFSFRTSSPSLCEYSTISPCHSATPTRVSREFQTHCLLFSNSLTAPPLTLSLASNHQSTAAMDPVERLGPTNADLAPLGFDQDMKGISDLTCSMFDLSASNRTPDLNELEKLQTTNDWLQLQNQRAKETVDTARNQIRGPLNHSWSMWESY